MSKDDLIYIDHMLEQAETIKTLMQGKTRLDYDNDLALRLALTHLVQVVGEAARLVSQPFRDSYPQIAWRDIVGMRHRVVHDYLNIDYEIVWVTITTEIPDLALELKRIIAASNP